MRKIFLLPSLQTFWLSLTVLPFVIYLAICAGCAGTTKADWPLDNVIKKVVALYGERGSIAAQEWARVLRILKSDNESQKLGDVNDYFNRKIRFTDDNSIWGVTDYWATPIETLIKGAGDCEDFAIAKYFSLKQLGVPVSKMRITYVEARIGGPNSSISQAHMVLAYYPTPDAEPLILDNLLTEIRPASRRSDLKPVFSFNSEGIFQAGSNTSQGSASRLSRWNDLIQKMKAEGFVE